MTKSDCFLALWVLIMCSLGAFWVLLSTLWMLAQCFLCAEVILKSSWRIWGWKIKIGHSRQTFIEGSGKEHQCFKLSLNRQTDKWTNKDYHFLSSCQAKNLGWSHLTIHLKKLTRWSAPGSIIYWLVYWLNPLVLNIALLCSTTTIA